MLGAPGTMDPYSTDQGIAEPEDPDYHIPDSWPSIRFGLETCIILLSVLFNTTGLALVYATHKERKSVYHILYINISVSNIVACPLTWFFGNIQFFFPTWFNHHLLPGSGCYPLAALLSRYKVVAALAVGVHMNIAMLSLAVCQYFAVCRPLQSIYIMQKRRAYAMILLAWIALLICAFVPGVAIYQASKSAVTADVISNVTNNVSIKVIMDGVRLTANTYSGIIVVIYVIMIVLAVLITTSLCQYSRRTYVLARSNSLSCDMARLQSEQRACIATAALLASRTIITVPLTIYFVYDLNQVTSPRSMAVFILSIVPCAKCIFDPFIYGSLMRDVKKTWSRVVMAWCMGNYGKYETDMGTQETMLTSDRSRMSTTA